MSPSYSDEFSPTKHAPSLGVIDAERSQNWRSKLAGAVLAVTVLTAPACSELNTPGDQPTPTEQAAEVSPKSDKPNTTEEKEPETPAERYQYFLDLSVQEYDEDLFVDFIEDELLELEREGMTVEEEIESRRRNLSDFTYDAPAHDYGSYSSSSKYDYRATISSTNGYPVWYKDFDPSEVTGQAMPIASITYENGALIALDSRPPSTRLNEFENDKYDELVGSVITPHAELIEEAITSGKLDSVEIALNASSSDLEIEFGAESSYYDTNTKKIVLILPTVTPERYFETESTLFHELAHAMVEGNFAHYLEETPGAADLEPKLRAACAVIRKSALDHAEMKRGELDTLMAKHMTLDPANAEHWQAIRDALAAGRLEDIQWTEATSPEGLAECYIANPNAMIGVHKDAVGVTESDNPTSDLSDEQIDSIFAIKDAFSSLIRSSEVLRTISEHGYTPDEYTGHPEDGSDELAASLVALAIQYQDEFAYQIKQLDTNNREAVLDAYSVVREVYIAQDPSYADQLPTVEELSR